MTGSAKQSMSPRKGRMDCFVASLLAMTVDKFAHTSAFPRRDAPGLCGKNVRPQRRGRRKCRMHAAPAVSCAKLCKETHTSIQVQRRQSGIPCAMALRLIARSPRRRIPFVTVASGLRLIETRLGRLRLRRLDISNGCQDHTTSPYAARLRQRHRRIVHPHRNLDQGGFSAVGLRAGRKLTSHKGSPCHSLCAPALPRPPHPLPNVRDDRDTPL
jgi:hypothetical protein